MDLLLQFGRIFYSIVLPMLLLSGIGYLLRRALRLDLVTLTRLNFYFVVPALIYYSVVSSRMTAADAATTVLFCVAMIVSLAAVAMLAAIIRRVPRDQRSVMVLATLSYNSGNYGLPLQDLAFSKADLSIAATSIQSFVTISQNLMNFTLGVLLAASGRKDRLWRDNLLHIAKFPPIYALAAAILTVQIRSSLGDHAATVAPVVAPFWKVIVYVKEAFVAVALLTLGAQLANVKVAAAGYPLRLTVLLRLLVGPAIGLAMVYAFGLHGLLGQVLLISTSTPTAVNAMLLCMEFDNHPSFVAHAVFYSTLLSPITVTAVIFLAQSGLLPGLAV